MQDQMINKITTPSYHLVFRFFFLLFFFFLTAYCPTESYEPKITPTFLNKLRIHLKLQRGIENENQDGNSLLCLSTVINPVLAFPYVQSTLLLKDVQVPPSLLFFF